MGICRYLFKWSSVIFTYTESPNESWPESSRASVSTAESRVAAEPFEIQMFTYNTGVLCAWFVPLLFLSSSGLWCVYIDAHALNAVGSFNERCKG